VSLKAKLCILKNYTFLLLGPSSFEQWCESYLCFTVRPLSFLLFTVKSSVFLLAPPCSSVSDRARVLSVPAAGTAPPATALRRHRSTFCFPLPRVILFFPEPALRPDTPSAAATASLNLRPIDTPPPPWHGPSAPSEPLILRP
jgi:hypothetical protein